MSSKHARLGRFLASARTRAALSLGVVLALGATGTFAHWTDSATIGGTTITAGTLDLQVDSVTYATLNLATMVPGNSVAGTLVIKNNGDVPLKYSAVASATNADSKNLGGSLTVRVTDGAVAGASPNRTCGGTVIAGATPTLIESLATPKRRLEFETTETICVQVTLASDALSTLQGATTEVTFTFTGTTDLS
jgi:predicted ribosomally synthesized peptide with SipW-like signal peptide